MPCSYESLLCLSLSGAVSRRNLRIPCNHHWSSTMKSLRPIHLMSVCFFQTPKIQPTWRMWLLLKAWLPVAASFSASHSRGRGEINFVGSLAHTSLCLWWFLSASPNHITCLESLINNVSRISLRQEMICQRDLRLHSRILLSMLLGTSFILHLAGRNKFLSRNYQIPWIFTSHFDSNIIWSARTG